MGVVVVDSLNGVSITGSCGSLGSCGRSGEQGKTTLPISSLSLSRARCLRRLPLIETVTSARVLSRGQRLVQIIYGGCGRHTLKY